MMARMTTDNEPPDWGTDTSLPTSDWDPGNVIWPVSTIWRSRAGKIDRRRMATQDSAPQAHRLSRMPRRNPRDPLTAVLKLRGGPEAWVEVRTRGAVVRVPGYTSVAELVLMLNSHF
jgi:hypothetical protein